MAMLSKYLFLLFGVSIAFYLVGYQSPMLEVFSGAVGTGGSAGSLILNSIYAIFTSPAFLLALGISLVSSFFLGGGSYSTFFVVPLVIFVAIFANMVILPSSYLFDPSLPFFLKAVIGSFFNLLLVLAIVDFVRGGAV
jgi:hypothetical protein